MQMIQFFMERGDWAAVIGCLLGPLAVLVHVVAAIFAMGRG